MITTAQAAELVQTGWTVASAGFVGAGHAEGVTEEIAPRRVAVTRVTLRPKIEWASAAPDKEALDRLHHEAHDICFIANSVKTEVTVE